MAHETLQTIIGTAIVDARFRSTLLRRPAEAVREFDLTPEECEALTRIKADTLHGFAHEVQLWLNRQTAPKVPTAAF